MTTPATNVPIIGTYLEQFIDKITLVPNDVNRYLRLIRFLDLRLQKIQKILGKQQKQLLLKTSQLKDKDKKLLGTAMQNYIKQNPELIKRSNSKLGQSLNLPLPLQQILSQYLSILVLQKKLIGYARQKTHISSQLSSTIRQYFQILQKQVRLKLLKQLRIQQQISSNIQQMPIQQLISYLKKRKLQQSTINNNISIAKRRDDYFYDPKEDKFCYCGEPSYGDMVFCQNLYCQKEWFHTTCLKETQLPEKWFCNDCQKMKDKTKHPVSRSYFSIS